MKRSHVLLLILLAGCSSGPPPQVALRPAEPHVAGPTLRYPETVRAYHVGRYVDGAQAMHEAHPVFRVENPAHWNLHAGIGETVGPLNPPRDAAFSPPVTDDAVVAEINHQRELTQRLGQQALQLTATYSNLLGALAQVQAFSSNTAALTIRLPALEQRVSGLDDKLGKLITTMAGVTNEPASAPPPSQP